MGILHVRIYPILHSGIRVAVSVCGQQGNEVPKNEPSFLPDIFLAFEIAYAGIDPQDQQRGEANQVIGHCFKSPVIPRSNIAHFDLFQA